MSADLEIGLHRTDKDEHLVELRVRMGPVDLSGGRGKAEFNIDALDRAPLAEQEGRAVDATPPDGVPRPLTYGKLLFEQLFADKQLLGQFDKALVAAHASDQPLRVRLFIGPSAAPVLHRLHWELLHDPRQPGPLWKGDRVHFSRYLSSSDWRPVQLRPRDVLRALVVVANPIDLDRYGMTAIPVATEVERARNNLGDIPVDEVTGPNTLANMMERLRDEYDLLYLVCHGGLGKTQEPRLWLEGADGTAAVTTGGEVVTLLADLWHRPRLVVLAACFSAGAGANSSSDNDAGVLAAIGPKLTEAGLPAVLAMQGRVTLETAGQFLTTFFRQVGEHGGAIDRAATIARGQVQKRPDHWMPVLFSRISHGKIWYEPGTSPATGEKFLDWPGLIAAIENRTCTPILGWGLLEGLVGSAREVARRWADSASFAMAPHQREDLPQVAQYLGTTQGSIYPRKQLDRRFREELRRRFRLSLPAASVDDLLAMARNRLVAAKRLDPYRVLARLPFRTYVTTNADDQLRRALFEAGRPPQVELCRWHNRDKVQWPESVFVNDPFFRPTEDQKPLIYHLYGRLDNPKSLVLTEDDYFDYLIHVHRERHGVPQGIRDTLSETALLFLGFRMDEWDFRVLFRIILAQADQWQLNRDFHHVAVQIVPEEGRNADPDKARHYLQEYFRAAQIYLYWGSVYDFLRELQDRWDMAQKQRALEQNA
jgi:hypothetical protein